MRRIAVIGPVASGKSTLARYLGARLGLPVVDLDDVYFSATRTFSDAEWPAVHRSLLEPDHWIIADDYRGVAGERFAKADMVVWLDLPRLVCSWRACCRRSGGTIRDCLRWIWRYPAHGRRETAASLREHAGATAVLRLRSQPEVRDFMATIARGHEPLLDRSAQTKAGA